MARRLRRPNRYGGTTDHSKEIRMLRVKIGLVETPFEALSFALAADLLQAHDQTGISLDHWLPARLFVESLVGTTILDSGI